MAWEHADIIFPDGYATLPNGDIITNDLLKESEIKTLYRPIVKLADNMVVQQKQWVWGADGEFTIQVLYDVYATAPHPNTEYYPLSEYGQSMLNDYLAFHNITFREDT